MKLIALFVLTAALGVVACGSARRGEAVNGPVELSDPALERGEVVFLGACHKCHPGGEAGLGPALNNKPLPAFLMGLQVRQGFGAMPAFSEEEISDDELDDLLAYVKELRAR